MVYEYKNEERKRMSKIKQFICVAGAVVALLGASIPLSSTKANSAISQNEVSIGVGIAKIIGVEITSETPGENVKLSNGTYSKTMLNGESIENFGTTTFDIICNFNNDPDDPGGPNCDENGWSLLVSPVTTVTKEGVAYASMNSSESSAAILSKSGTLSPAESTWAIKVSPITSTIDGADVSPAIADGYTSLHLIPATSTEIATAKSWKTINNQYTYIPHFGVSVQYGIGVANSQAAGSYSGALNYTVSLKAST